MSRDRAAYMREYRRRKGVIVVDPDDPTEMRLRAQIEQLEDEVKYLKAELAKRPAQTITGHQYSTRPFTPVPKK